MTAQRRSDLTLEALKDEHVWLAGFTAGRAQQRRDASEEARKNNTRQIEADYYELMARGIG